MEDQVTDELHHPCYRRTDFVDLLRLHSCKLFSLVIDKRPVVFPALDHGWGIDDVEHGLHETVDFLNILEHLALGFHMMRLYL
jgi:hypothetical protein